MARGKGIIISTAAELARRGAVGGFIPEREPEPPRDDRRARIRRAIEERHERMRLARELDDFG